MAWIESHQELVHHPKVLDLSHATGWRLTESIGAMHRLWWWTLAYAESGYLGDYEPEVISRAIDALETEKYSHEMLFEVLQNVKFMTKNNFIHDWLDYAGRYLKTKYHSANPEKLNDIKENFNKKKGSLKAPRRRTKGPVKSNTFTYLPTYLNLPTLTNLCLALEEILIKCKGELSKHILSDKFLESYLEWTLYKKDKKDPITKHSIHKQFDNLAGHEVDISIKMIDQAIEREWKGIYPLKGDGSGATKGPTAEQEKRRVDIKRDIKIVEESLPSAQAEYDRDPSPENDRWLKGKQRELAKLLKELEG